MKIYTSLELLLLYERFREIPSPARAYLGYLFNLNRENNKYPHIKKRRPFFVDVGRDYVLQFFCLIYLHECIYTRSPVIL